MFSIAYKRRNQWKSVRFRTLEERQQSLNNVGKTPVDQTLTRIRQITEELYLVHDELNKRAATQPSELSSALFDSEASNELVALKRRSMNFVSSCGIT